MAKSRSRVKRNMPKKFNKTYIENSIWEIRSISECNKELLFNYWGEIWSVTLDFFIQNSERVQIGNWEFTKNTLFVKIHHVPDKLAENISSGTFVGFPSISCSSIDFKRNMGRKGWVSSFSIYSPSTERATLKTEFFDEGYLANFVSPQNKYPRYKNDLNLLFKEPFYLFIDIETNGLPTIYADPSLYPEVYPDIIQIAVIYCDSNGRIILRADGYIFPQGWSITEDTKRFLGINEGTLDTIKSFGVFLTNKEFVTHSEHSFHMDCDPVDEFLKQIFGFLMDYDVKYIVGHNIEFDINCLLALYYRHLNDEQYSVFTSTFHKTFIRPIEAIERICTMKATTEYCRIESKHGYKYPKLEELYGILFGEDLNNAHNAINDVYATAKCYWKLREMGVLSGGDPGYKNVSDSEWGKSEKIKLTELIPIGDCDAFVQYEQYLGKNQISDGKAYCPNIHGIEIDDEDFLIGNFRLSKDGKILDFPIKVKITNLSPIGKKDCFMEYEKYIGDNLISSGRAYCPNVDGIEIDDADFLVGSYIFSGDGKILFSPEGDNS
jgi:DNA polymerase III epsilon subunit-like protein